MATYPKCKVCGNDLTWKEEQEEGFCWDCMQRLADEGDFGMVQEEKDDSVEEKDDSVEKNLLNQRMV